MFSLKRETWQKLENVIVQLYKLAEGSQDLLVPEFI